MVNNPNSSYRFYYHRISKTTKPTTTVGFKLSKYSGTESNRHSHYCEQDFKSCVSTSSTTRVTLFVLYKYKTNFEKKSRHRRDILLSGRPGSNRPPRPWQGRALPNELLPQDV